MHKSPEMSISPVSYSALIAVLQGFTYVAPSVLESVKEKFSFEPKIRSPRRFIGSPRTPVRYVSFFSFFYQLFGKQLKKQIKFFSVSLSLPLKCSINPILQTMFVSDKFMVFGSTGSTNWPPVPLATGAASQSGDFAM